MIKEDSLEEALTTCFNYTTRPSIVRTGRIIAQIREVYSFVEAILIGKKRKYGFADKHEDRSDFKLYGMKNSVERAGLISPSMTSTMPLVRWNDRLPCS